MRVDKTKSSFFQPLCKFIDALITHQLKPITIKKKHGSVAKKPHYLQSGCRLKPLIFGM